MYVYSGSRCLVCSWTTEVEAGQRASDRDAVTNLLRNAMDEGGPNNHNNNSNHNNNNSNNNSTKELEINNTRWTNARGAKD